MRVDPAWDCPGLCWEVGAGLGGGRRGLVGHPRDPLGGSVPGMPRTPLPEIWRANFYRIERPRDGAAEFSAWSPTLTAPADFHQPARFGFLDLGPLVSSPAR